MKKHLIILTEKENKMLQKIKKEMGFDNVNEVFQFLIKNYSKKLNKKEEKNG